jgi:predicted lipoprotein with Yx(FWY)xxD motif
MRNRGWTAAGTATGLGGLVLLLAACGSSATNTNAGAAYGGSGMSATPSSSAMNGAGSTSGMGTKTVTLTIKSTKIGKVLTDAKGDTLYWYSKDAKDGPSTCTASCLKEWPMVTGKAVAAPGVKLAGKLGDVTDAGGAVQASYNGYPLYTYAGDMAPGDTAGNNEGGVWHVITGSTLTASTGMGSSGSKAAATPTKAAGGYGYGGGVPVSSGTSSGSSGSSGAPGASGGSAGSQGSTAHTRTTTAPAPASAPSTAAPAPAPTSPVNGGGCGEGSCW